MVDNTKKTLLAVSLAQRRVTAIKINEGEHITAIKLRILIRITTRDYPQQIITLRRGNPLWLPLTQMAVILSMGTILTFISSGKSAPFPKQLITVKYKKLSLWPC